VCCRDIFEEVIKMKNKGEEEGGRVKKEMK